MAANSYLTSKAKNWAESTSTAHTTCAFFYLSTATPVVKSMAVDTTNPQRILATFYPPSGTTSLDKANWYIHLGASAKDEYYSGDEQYDEQYQGMGKHYGFAEAH